MKTKSFSMEKLAFSIFIAFAITLFACSADGAMGELEDEFEKLSSSSSYEEEYNDDEDHRNDDDETSSSSKKSSSSQKHDESKGATEVKTSSKTNFDPTLASDSIFDSQTREYIHTVQIGSYVWIIGNANKATSYSRCYNNKTKNCDVYGKLYYGTYQNICPDKFFVATTEAWEDLFQNAGTAANLKSKGLWEASKNASAGKNTFGLSLLPGGHCYGTNCFDQNEIGYYYAEGSPALVYMFRYDSDVILSKKLENFDEYETMSVSVRCVKRATKIQKESDLPTPCNTNDTARVIETGYKYICTNKSNWTVLLDTLPVTCAKKDEGKLFQFYAKDYACLSGKMKFVTALDREFGFCKEKQKTTTKDSTIYVCVDGEWEVGDIEDAYGKCTSKEPLKIIHYQYQYYVCADSIWRTANYEEQQNGLCNTSTNGTVKSYNNYLRICDKGTWRNATFNEAHGECADSSQWKEVEDGAHYYVCRNGNWDKYTIYEQGMGVCNPSKTGKMDTYNGYHYICKDNKWTSPTLEDIPIRCTTSIADSIVKVTGASYVCDATIPAWRTFTKEEYKFGICNEKNDGINWSYRNPERHYVCKNRLWVEVDSLTFNLGECTSEKENKTGTLYRIDYVCKNNKWELATLSDMLGQCSSSNNKDTITYRDTLRICYNSKWVKATFSNMYGLCNNENEGKIIFDIFDQTWRTCHSSGWDFTTIEDYYTCNASNVDEIKEMPNAPDKKYYCKHFNFNGSNSYSWISLSERDQAIGLCIQANIGKTATYKDSILTCNEYKLNGETYYSWERASKLEALGTCNSSNEGQVVKYASQTNICTGGKWTVKQGNIDGYKTIDLAGNIWMAENVDATKTGGYCYSGNNNSGCSHGGFYTHEDAENACPTGWKLPDTSDFRAIIDTVGYYTGFYQNPHNDIFDTSSNSWQASSDRNGPDAYGFSLIGIGYCTTAGNCSGSMTETYLWTSTKASSGFYAYKFTYQGSISKTIMTADSYLGVRCIKK